MFYMWLQKAQLKTKKETNKRTVERGLGRATPDALHDVCEARGRELLLERRVCSFEWRVEHTMDVRADGTVRVGSAFGHRKQRLRPNRAVDIKQADALRGAR
jgi:hypothetical protein